MEDKPIGLFIGIAFVILVLALLPEMFSGFGTFEVSAAPTLEGRGVVIVPPTPTKNIPLTVAAITPISEIVTTPVQDPRAEYPPPRIIPNAVIVKEPVEVFVFDDKVPNADAPEITADQMNSCFSSYSRHRNQIENTCLGEWYPMNYAPRPHDDFWCAENGGVVEWVPARFFDGRTNVQVEPFGKPSECY